MPNSFVQNFLDAEVDAISLSEFIYKPADFMVERRLAPPMNTMNYFLQYFNGISSIYTQPTGYVTVTGAVRKTIGQMAIDATNTVNAAIEQSTAAGSLVTDALIKSVPRAGMIARNQQSINNDSITVKDFGAISDGAYHPLSERYATLEEAQDVYPHADALTDSLDWCAAQAFLDACHENKYANADMTIDATVNRTLVYGTHKFHATQVISGDVVLRGLDGYPMDYFVIWQGAYTNMTGSFTFWGSHEVGLSKWVANRICKNGIIVGSPTILNNGANGALGAKINSVVAYNLSGYAAMFGNSAHFAEYGYVHAELCGSADAVNGLGDDRSLKSSWTNRIDANIGVQNGTSTITVDILPHKQAGLFDTQIQEEKLVIIDGETYAVELVDYEAKTLRIRPTITSTNTEGSLKYIYGGGVITIGSDTANTVVTRMNAILCGIGLRLYSLWGTAVSSFTSEFCGAGIVLSSKASISMSSSILNAYFEANKLDLLELWSQSYSGLIIHNSMGLNIDKMESLFTFMHPSGVRLASTGGYSRLNSTVKIKHRVYSSEWEGFLGDLNNRETFKMVYANSSAFTLTSDPKLERLYGKANMLYCFNGQESSSGNPTGTITLTAGDGLTIKSGTTATTFVINGSDYDAPILVAVNLINFGRRLEVKVITPKKSVTASNATSGVTANRPQGMLTGYMYFDTTLGYPVYYEANGIWVDSTGATA